MEQERVVIGFVHDYRRAGAAPVAVGERGSRDEPVVLLVRVREEDRSRRRLRDGGEEQGVRLLLAASPDDRGARDGPEDVADDPGPPGFRVPPGLGVAPRERQEKKLCAALLDEAPGEAGRVGPPAAEGAGQRRGKFLVPGADLDSDRDGVREFPLGHQGQGGLPPHGDGPPSFARGQGHLHDPPGKGLLREDDRHTSGFRERAGCPTFLRNSIRRSGVTAIDSSAIFSRRSGITISSAVLARSGPRCSFNSLVIQTMRGSPPSAAKNFLLNRYCFPTPMKPGVWTPPPTDAARRGTPTPHGGSAPANSRSEEH